MVHFFYLARWTGIEPVTSWFVARHSIQLSYKRVSVEVPAGFEPAVIELQSIALPTWLRNHHSGMYYITDNNIVSSVFLINKKATPRASKSCFYFIKILVNSDSCPHGVNFFLLFTKVFHNAAAF